MKQTRISLYVVLLGILTFWAPPGFGQTHYGAYSGDDSYTGTIGIGYAPWTGNYGLCQPPHTGLFVGGAFRMYQNCSPNGYVIQEAIEGNPGVYLAYRGDRYDHALPPNYHVAFFFAYADCDENDGNMVVEADEYYNCTP